MHYVYLLESVTDFYRYVGMTKDLQKRLDEHNTGISLSTKSHRPYKVLYYECFESSKDAWHREKYFKTGKGREELKVLCMKNT